MFTRHFSLFLALRYLKPKRTFVSVITLISILGVTLAIALLIVVMAVMTGFQVELEKKVIGFEPHLVIRNANVMEDWVDVMNQSKSIPNVRAAAPYVQAPVIIEFANRRMAPKIRAIDPELEREVVDIKPFIKDGAYDLDGNKTILGIDLAREMGVTVGDTIMIYSPRNLNAVMEELDRAEKDGAKPDVNMLKQLILPIELEVTGVFESGRYLYDSDFLLVPLFIGQELYDLGGAVHGLALKTDDPYKATEVQRQLDAVLEPPNYSMTWIDLNAQMFAAIHTERNVMFIILTIAIVVAAFCIMNTQITTTVQKTREIGVLKALGARTNQIIGLFFAQGIVIGVFGTLGGLLLGVGFIHIRNDFRRFLVGLTGQDPFPASIYQFSEIPAKIVPNDLLVICLSAFVICSVAALIPAWFAARLDPVKALRYE